jgi:hypothetical protein
MGGSSSYFLSLPILGKKELNMKVKFKHGIAGYSGKNNATGMIYCYNKKKRECIERHPCEFKPTEHSEKFARICQNLNTLYTQVFEGYKQDLKKYAHYQHRMSNSHAIFLTLMWKLSKQFQDIDLEHITIEDIRDKQYPIQTITEAMNAFILKRSTLKYQDNLI